MPKKILEGMPILLHLPGKYIFQWKFLDVHVYMVVTVYVW